MKRIISVILVMLMLTATAFAVRPFEETDGSKLNIVIDGGTGENRARAGEEVPVSIRLVNNNTISSLKVILTYSEKLTVVTTKNKKGEDVPSVTFDIFDPDDPSAHRSVKLEEDKKRLTLNWVSAQDEVRGDCVYATIVFKVSDDAVEGDFLPVEVAVINPNDVFDIDQQNIDFKVINGGIDIVNVMKGDVDNDGMLTDKDVMMLAKSLSGEEPAGFVAAAGDFNGDGETNNKDVVSLFAVICEYTYDLPGTERPADPLPEGKPGIVANGFDAAYNGIIGGTVDVKISLKNNPGVSTLKAVVYWSDKLTLVNAVYDVAAGDESARVKTAADWSEVSGSFAFNWVSSEKTAEGDVTFVTLTFNISEDAAANEFLYVAVTADNIYTASGEAVEFTAMNGGVDPVELGDPTGDGNIDNKDVTTLFRFVSGALKETDIIAVAADFNGDNEVNNKDVVALFKHVSSIR